jgi:hypothetical protein
VNQHFAAMLEAFFRGLEQPEYVHVLLNPLPVYGLTVGLAALTIALALRSRAARICALVIIFIASASGWPVTHFGHQGYYRVKAMSDSEGQKWLDEHVRRANRLIYVFYAAAAVALVSIGADWKRSKAALPLTILTLLLATGALGVGGYVAYAGGHIRHKEFRFEPAPDPHMQEQQSTSIERDADRLPGSPNV